MKKLLCILTLVFILFVQMGLTQTPIAIKGVAIDSEGMPIPNGNKLITFAIYESQEATTPIWYEQQEVPVEDGYFIARLGSVNDLEVSFEDALWLGMKIGDGEEMKPRMKLNKMGGDFTMAQKRRIVTDAGKSSENAIDRDGATATTESVTTPGAPPDIQHLDDVIISFSLCVGNDCVNGESFGFDTIRLKENNLRIKFQDTSNTASFPTRDWMIEINDSNNGGANYFAVHDVDAGRKPFLIEGNAPANALYVEDAGRVGFGTSTPVVELHVKDGDTPTLRLEQDGSSGWSPQTWDVAGNEANFFIRDVTNGSQLPFRIKPGANSDALFINSDDNIGLGTNAPDEKLYVHDGNIKIYDSNTGDATEYGIIFSDGTKQTTAGGGGGGYWIQAGSDIYYNTGDVGIGTTSPYSKLDVADGGMGITVGADLNVSTRTNNTNKYGRLGSYHYTNAEEPVGVFTTQISSTESVLRIGGGTSLQNASTQIDFYTAVNNTTTTGTSRLTIENDGDITVNNGNVDVNGDITCVNLTETSDIRWKKNIKTINSAMDKVRQMRGVKFDWRRDEFQNKKFEERTQIGFIAQEVEAVVPEFVRTGTDGYKSVAYSNVTALLVEAIKDQQNIIEEQKAAIDAVNAKLVQLEMLVQKLSPRQVISTSAAVRQTSRDNISLPRVQIQKPQVEQEIDENGRPIGSAPEIK